MRHVLSALGGKDVLSTIDAVVRTSLRFVAGHTGLPALVVAAIMVVGGYRLLRRSARFVVEVAVVALVLAVATKMGWITW